MDKSFTDRVATSAGSISRIIVADTDYTSTSADKGKLIVITNLTDNRTITFPSASANSNMIIGVKDESGLCDTFLNIIITAASGDIQMGAGKSSSFPMSIAYDGYWFYSNGVDWLRLR